jgi:hypothetical protein
LLGLRTNKALQVGFKAMIYYLCLPIGLGVVTGTEFQLSTLQVEEFLPEFASEYSVAVGYD